MNQEEKCRITQNLTYLKERLVDLDPIIDRLIENDVFRIDHREKIEQISKPTPHRQFNEFIKLLTTSGSRDAYPTFLDALKVEGYNHIAQKLQRTTLKECKFIAYGGNNSKHADTSHRDKVRSSFFRNT